MEPNSAGLCHNCLRNSVDITEGIPSQSTLSFCRNCSRYLSPPSTWLLADLESRELLAICLRKLKGLSKVRLIDAGFIWTEPHSKRLRVKLTIQKEVSEPDEQGAVEVTRGAHKFLLAYRSSTRRFFNKYSKSSS